MESNQGYSNDYQVAEIGLVYKNVTDLQNRPQITSSKIAYELLLASWDKDTIDLQESFKVLLLNRNSKVLGIYEMSMGSTCGTLVDPKLVFTAALRAAACNIIIAHNHPSGNTKPSEADKLLTQKISEGAKLLDIRLLDHIIITNNGHLSFADDGLM